MSGKKTFTLLFIQLFILGVGGSIVGPLIPIISDSFEVSLDVVGSTLSLNAFGLLLASMFSGILSERFGKNKMLVTASILFSVSFLSLYLSNNFIYFTISYFIFGISWGIISLICNSLISDIFDSNRSSQIIRINIGYMLGAAFAPLIVSSILFFNVNWRYLFLFIALINTILFIFILLFKNRIYIEKKDKENFASLFSNSRKLLSNPVIIFCGIICFLHAGLGFSFGSWFTTYFKSISVPVNISSLILSLNTFIFCAGMLVQSFLLNKLSEERLMQFLSIPAFIFLFTAFISDNLIVKIVFIALFQFSFSGIAATSISTGIKENPRYSATITGLINSFSFTGTIAFQYMAGYLMENYSKSSIFYTSLGALFLMIIITSILNSYSVRKRKVS